MFKQSIILLLGGVSCGRAPEAHTLAASLPRRHIYAQLPLTMNHFPQEPLSRMAAQLTFLVITSVVFAIVRASSKKSKGRSK